MAEKTSTTQGQIGEFLENLKHLEAAIVTQLQSADSKEPSSSISIGDGMGAGHLLTQMTKLVSEYAPILPSYELQKAQSRLSLLQKRWQESSSQPKSKFKFVKASDSAVIPSRNVQSKKTHHFGASDVTDALSQDSSTGASTPSLDGPSMRSLNGSDGSTLTRKNLQHETVVLTAEDTHKRDVCLTRLSHCRVLIQGIPSTVHLAQLYHCDIITGPVTTSIFVEECVDCRFLIACQQLRAHSTRSCDFYVHVTSRAIIEDSQRVRFAPYNRSYHPETFAAAGLDPRTNHWDQVDDFNWLSTQQASPHWSIIPEDEREFISWEDEDENVVNSEQDGDQAKEPDGSQTNKQA